MVDVSCIMNENKTRKHIDIVLRRGGGEKEGGNKAN
jgi:hypothetical protein